MMHPRTRPPVLVPPEHTMELWQDWTKPELMDAVWRFAELQTRKNGRDVGRDSILDAIRRMRALVHDLRRE